VAAAQDLLGAVRAIGSEGLEPRDYDPDRLAAAISGGDPAVLAQVATDTFNKLSWDVAMGHVRGSARQQWYVTDKDLNAESQRALLLSALASNGVSAAIRSLLPTHPQYGALRNALTTAAPTDTATVNRIRLNMDRWRWLPRDLGNRYIIVNVPGQFATLVENAQTRWKHRAIAGATKTPTPQLSVMATGVILNPWWEVPASLTREVAGKRGYVAVKGKDGKVQRWRQPPGASNALGKIKFVMPNSHAIYLHDTNNRGLFDSRARFLSHGCIRTEKILDLAAELLGDDGGEWTQEKIDGALASGKSVQANFVKPVPVYIVYFSAAALVDGNIVRYDDLYKRDAPVLAALLNRDGRGPATAKPAVKAAAGKAVVKAPVKKTASN
jgi:murein L,D-transpeptidase YcbB/YkuD